MIESRILVSAISRKESIFSERLFKRSRTSARLRPSCASISARIEASRFRTSMSALFRIISSRLSSWRSSWTAISSCLRVRKAARRSSISTSSSRAVSSLSRSRSVSKVRRSLRSCASSSAIMALRAAVSRDWNSISRRSAHSVRFASYCSSIWPRSSVSRSNRNRASRF